MICDLECMYCGHKWEEYVGKYSRPWCRSCKDELNLKIKAKSDEDKIDYYAKTLSGTEEKKIDYYEGSPPFPTKEQEYTRRKEAEFRAKYPNWLNY